MRKNIIFVVAAVVAVVALLLIAGCSKQTPATQTGATPAQQVTAPVATIPAPAVQEAMQEGPATPPELTQADQTVQDLGTSGLDQVSKDIDALTVP